MENFEQCCMYDLFGSCSSYMGNRYSDWPSHIINLCDLKEDVGQYLVRLGVLSLYNQASYQISEETLILNRLAQHIDIEQPFIKICPLHRYSFGIGWRDNGNCLHPDHKSSFEIIRKKRKRNQLSDNRVVPLHLYRYSTQFPYGGRVCGSHLKALYASLKDDISVDNQLSTSSGFHSYYIKEQKKDELEITNEVLLCLNQSPLKSQTTMSLEEQTPGAIRRLTAKLRQAVSVAASNFAETMAPGQGEKLLDLAKLDSINRRRSSNASKEVNPAIDLDYLTCLIRMYNAYEQKGLPFSEQVRVLSLIPDSWKMTSQMIQEKFNCSNHAVKTARRLKKQTDTPMHIDEKSPNIRQRLDPQKVSYFIDWIVETKLLTSIPWGVSNLKLDNGELLPVPRQMLQAQKSQVIYLYKQHCNQANIDGISPRTIYSILDSFNASQQTFVSGIDDFVQAASDSWKLLEKIIDQLPIMNHIKTDLHISLEKSKVYLKCHYGLNCGADVQMTSHCTIFALSQSKNVFHSQSCNHTHTVYCEDCISIGKLFDEIENIIDTFTDKELKAEFMYDFQSVVNNIFEFMSHRLRTTHQEEQKRNYIQEMDLTTAFLTVDWSQKILPQKFREGQSSYFGKKGMSLLVGSFMFKESSNDQMLTRTYMVGFNKCSQTEYETLCAGYLILKEFHHDHPHITKLIKRSDNASVLAGRLTIQYEKILCDSLGIKLLMRDYSEIQSGKSICDRMSGSAKLRMRSYAAAGNDVIQASDVKKGMEYGGGIKHLKVAVAEFEGKAPALSAKRVPDLCSIRNIVYDTDGIILRKSRHSLFGIDFRNGNESVSRVKKKIDSNHLIALINGSEPIDNHSIDVAQVQNTGLGTGQVIEYENRQFTNKINLVNSFEKFESVETDGSTSTMKKRSDRSLKSFFFCPNESCIDTFESEDELNIHLSLDQHSTHDSSLRLKDKAKLMLFEKMRIETNMTLSISKTTSASISTEIPRHCRYFANEGWAIRTRKPSKPIDKNVKAFVKSIFDEEKRTGRKTPVDDYINYIRTARNPDGSKKFVPSQYLTRSQIQNQIKMFSKATTNTTSQNTTRTKDVRSSTSTASSDESQSALHSSLSSTFNDIETSDEEDENIVESATQLELFKQLIIADYS